MVKIVDKAELFKTIDTLAKEFEVIGPRELRGKGIFYQPVTCAQDLYTGERLTTEPVKKFFLSPSQDIFKVNSSQANESLEEIPLSQNKRMIIGVRPCEAKGLTLLDKVFDSEDKDIFYSNNRKQTIIVGMSCLGPDQNCFCTSIGGTPVDSRGMDALIFPAGNEFVIEIITDKGKDIFGACGRSLSKKEGKTWDIDKEKRSNVLKKKIKIPENLNDIFESGYWQKASFPCLSCGICTYLCPTCHCFDLVDEERKRLRCYDGCAFSDFTLEASGANPRPAKIERFRQRVFHKFSYFKKNFGEHLCVGCGRCIRHCPAKMDISEIVENASAA